MARNWKDCGISANKWRIKKLRFESSRRGGGEEEVLSTLEDEDMRRVSLAESTKLPTEISRRSSL